ncbi:MAG: hypothetical protein HY904_23625 [Deltaproteobacteria bacterium]|nr:hypothetical protein [Deltaproteobacteria bacterium]
MANDPRALEEEAREIAVRRIELLRRLSLSPNEQDTAEFVVLTRQLRVLSPRVTPEDEPALREVERKVAELEAWVAAKRAKPPLGTHGGER